MTYIEWILRIGVAGEFIGHGMLALQGKQQWVGWVHQMTGFDMPTATHFLFIIGLSDLLVAFIVLVKPIRPVLLWAAFWGFWTALLRPLVGESVLDFVERSANWAAPLALYFLLKKQKKEFQ
ncbi:hypothetical protein HYW41_03670 [Candidatus Daviesbacteria bacterium]|nr:hypothetical protein [Candidatus Daviesbacteria bacterium]MBI4028884.1 hypothetical protein [Candidatus Blackburnbacteria bacterium]